MNYVILFLLVRYIVYYSHRMEILRKILIWFSVFSFFLNFLFNSLMKYSFVLLCKYEKLN